MEQNALLGKHLSQTPFFRFQSKSSNRAFFSKIEDHNYVP